MTSERTKAVLAILLTFIVGIVIGIFIPGLVRKAQFSERDGRFNEYPARRSGPPSGDRFERAIYRVINPDSVQEEKMKSLSLIHNTTTRIAAIHRNANNEIKLAMDSLITSLTNFKGLLREDQQKRLEDFEKQRAVEIPNELDRGAGGRRGFGPDGRHVGPGRGRGHEGEGPPRQR